MQTADDQMLYYGKFGTPVAGVGTLEEKFYKVSKIAADSGIPAGLKVKDILWGKGRSLKAGDEVIPIELVKIGFVTNTSFSKSKTSFEATTQVHSAKSWIISKKVDISGSLNGHFDDKDEVIDIIENEFGKKIKDDGTNITVKETTGKTHHLFLYKNDPQEIDDWLKVEYLPCIFEGYDSEKPLEGIIPFNTKYKGQGMEEPCTYELKKTA